MVSVSLIFLDIASMNTKWMRLYECFNKYDWQIFKITASLDIDTALNYASLVMKKGIVASQKDLLSIWFGILSHIVVFICNLLSDWFFSLVSYFIYRSLSQYLFIVSYSPESIWKSPGCLQDVFKPCLERPLEDVFNITNSGLRKSLQDD